MSAQKPIKVAVIGGGCAAMAAAFELTRPTHQGAYAVTVYQLGWRLGGKGASGRGPAGRIEEHGLHLWMGFYENAFRLMRECYEELGRDPVSCPITTWRDAFSPAPFVGVAERTPDGGWVPWGAAFPPVEGSPGTRRADEARWTVSEYLVRGVGLLRALFASLGGPAAGAPPEPASSPGDIAPIVAARLKSFLAYGELATLAAMIEAAELLQTALGDLSRYPNNLVVRFIDALGASARRQVDARGAVDSDIRRIWTIVDLTLATMRGIVRSRLATDPRGFDAIDEYDCREWLLLNGASEASVQSGYLRGLYDLGFSYEDGDPAKPRIAAGQALRSLLRAFFTYRGSFFWHMRAGMGDVVFAPLYEVLKRRGVRFEFFRRLENVRLASAPADGSSFVEALEFDVQAEIKDGRPYDPLVTLGGLPCWPAAPDYAQLTDGEALREQGIDFESFWDRRRVRSHTLHVAEDFDLVVLAVGIGAIPYVCREIVARDPRWRAMVDHVRTVPTQAFQIWMRVDMSDLGWTQPPITLSGFVEPFDTWADMRHVIVAEQWPDPPRALAYFCNALPDRDGRLDRSDIGYPAREHHRVREHALRFLQRDIGHLWPRAVDDRGEFRWDVLVDPSAGAPAEGSDRFTSQYWTANVNPSDRYALSLPGSSKYRLSPLDETYDNLTIAGDWTACGFNAGCVEAAVMSGRLAAHALSQSPPLEDIIGFDHP